MGERYGPAAEAILCLTAGVPPLPSRPTLRQRIAARLRRGGVHYR